MPIAGLSYVTVTGTYMNLVTGDPSAGTVRFTGAPRLVNTTTNQVVIPGDFVAALDANGQFSIDVPATDDPDFAPADWTWVLRQIIDGAILEDRIALPAAPSTQDIADIVPLDDIEPGRVYTRAAAGTWDDPVRVGAGNVWTDATGDLRIKTTAPTTDLDGVVVGTQS